MNNILKNLISKINGKKGKEEMRWKGVFSIEKFADDEAVKNNAPYMSEVLGENLLVNTGINAILTQIATGSGGLFGTGAYLGVGDDATPAAATQTDLIGAGKVRAAMNGSYPTYGTSQQIVFQADFTGAVANIHWQEMAVFTASVAGIMLNRKVSDQGTKTSGQTWRLTLEITLS